MSAEALTSPRLRLRFRLTAKAASGTVAGLGALVLVGWILDIPALKSVQPGLASMKANSAFCFLLLGAALWVSDDAHRRVVRRLLAAIIAIAGALTLAEYLIGADLRIDQLLLVDRTTPGAKTPAEWLPRRR